MRFQQLLTLGLVGVAASVAAYVGPKLHWRLRRLPDWLAHMSGIAVPILLLLGYWASSSGHTSVREMAEHVAQTLRGWARMCFGRF